MRRIHTLIGTALMAGSLGACGSDIGVGSIRLPKFTDASSLSFRSAEIQQEVARPVTAEDLVGPDGRCSGQVEAAPAESEQGMPSRGGIALRMMECEVVARAGGPDQVDVGASEQGERSVVMTYRQGTWPGVYRFVAGRLVTIERVAEPETKPQRKGRAAARKK